MIEIKPMNQSHVSAIAQIEQRCFSDPWSSRSIESELTNPLSLWLVAMEGNNLVGYVGAQTVMPESDMMNLAVVPEYRRCGVAQALVQTLMDALSDEGAECLSLEVRESNAPAIALYEKLGFVQVGKRPNYYRSPKEDAMIMRKEWTL